MERFAFFECLLRSVEEDESPNIKKAGTKFENTVASVLPHHPSVRSAQTEKSLTSNKFKNEYQKFYSDLVGSVQNKSLIVRHKLCSALYTLENIVRLIDKRKIYYRCLLAFNIFKDSNGTLTSSHIELSKESLFSNDSSYSNNALQMILDAVVLIRDTVGLKNLQDAFAPAWDAIRKLKNPADKDMVITGSILAEPYSYTPTMMMSRVFTALAHQYECAASDLTIFKDKPKTVVINEIESKSTELNSSQEIGFNDPGPSTSYTTTNALDDALNAQGMNCLKLLSSLKQAFPDTYEEVAKYLFQLIESTKSNAELQEEVTNLLGFDLIELAISILETREDLSAEIKRNRQKPVDINRFDQSLQLDPVRNNGPVYCQQVTVQTKREVEIRKEMKREQKRMKKEWSRIQNAFGDEEKLELELAQKEMERERQLEIDRLKWTPTLRSGQVRETYPFVFDARFESGFAAGLNKSFLPEGSFQEVYNSHDLVVVPAVKKTPVGMDNVYINQLDEIGQLGFKGFEKLNIIQSIVFEQAYKTKENLLICAPTGAGKTNIAMLTILNIVHQYLKPNGDIAKDDFKIIYIAPMKALATEMTESFGKRLAPLGLTVKELTGDTQLSKKEISETQMLVVTPEKWDVVTRKGTADNSLACLVRLLIIDEVHLLQDDRGPVIETIVSRTLRQVEMSQSGIRILGLSATLPNYVDVAKFLRVNPYKGLFFFDERFRPVPLNQRFIGVKKAGGTQKEVQEMMDELCYEEVRHHVKDGNQVLVFVHARNATRRVALDIVQRAARLGHRDIFLPPTLDTAEYGRTIKSLQSRNGQLLEVVQHGLGVHHAGLLRKDRLTMEKMFANGHLTVLVCTSTLAWGVNLPAHAVIIRGTDVFDAEKGQFSNLGVLDVQQIFGRAGRPQFQTEGHGTIITHHAKMGIYLGMLTRKDPIESQFHKRLHDNLNAEIALGTVSNVDEAVEWLTYSYYYTRILINPVSYGLSYKELEQDPDLYNHLRKMITTVATKLDDLQMIRYDGLNGFLNSTDLGRIASDFYIKYETIELLENPEGGMKFGQFMPDDMILGVISTAKEFSQIKVRDDEYTDLEELTNFACMLPIKSGGLASTPGKINVLLQALISKYFVKSFSLASECLYVSQNAGRLCRALFEITLRKGWAQATNACLTMSKCIEKKIWRHQSCLRQLPELVQTSLIEKIERRNLSEDQLLGLTPKELETMFRCDGEKIHEALHSLPRVDIEATIKPITYTIVQVDAWIYPAFKWNDRIYGKTGVQSFLLLLENINENLIVHNEKILLNKKKVLSEEPLHIVFTIPVRDHELTNVFQLRVCSDYYIVDDTVVPLSLHNCVLPKSIKSHTDLLDLDPLPVTTLQNPLFQSIYNYSYFNPIQTQVFHCLYKTDESALIGAPTGSGKTCCAELTIFRLLQAHPDKKCVYIAPLKALVRERVQDWKEKFENNMGYKVSEVSGDFTPDSATLSAASILITTPEKWDGITRSWTTREYVRKVGLIVIDEIHLLGVDRGAVLEAIVTRLKSVTKKSYQRDTPARLVGLSTALANAGDIAEWLGIKDAGLFNFRPSVRPVPINVHIQGFPGQHYCPRMALMNKPAFNAITTYSPFKPVLVFVASRRQTRLTAMAFISHLVAQGNPKQWLHIEEDELEMHLLSIKDENLKLTLQFGIGMHHAGLAPAERSVVEQLFTEKKIQVLIATSTLAWGINMPAHLVIVKGTEFFDGKLCKYVDFPVTDVLQMMGRAGRPQYDDSAVAVIYVHDIKKVFYKRFLYEPFPVESSMLPVLANHVNAEINSGTISSKQGVMEYISETYLYRRLFANPNFYGLEEPSETSLITFLTNIVDQVVKDLLESKCIIIDEEQGSITSSPYGRLASIYYLRHETIRYLLDKLNENSTIEDTLLILSHTPEYSEIPLRHNEDLENAQLQRKMRIRFPTSAMDSSNTKAHLLFQAQFSRVTIPCDYRTDQKSVLDQCVRIIQAMRDICTLNGWASTTMACTILQQMCHSGRWYDDHPLSVLPILSIDECIHLGKDMTIPMLQDKLRIENAKDFQDVLRNARKSFSDLSLSKEQLEKVVHYLLDTPILNVKKFEIYSNENCFIVPLASAFSTKLHASSTCKLIMHIDKLGPGKSNVNANLPLWTKEKTAGWIVTVSDLHSRKLLCTSHITPIKDFKAVRVLIPTPSIRGKTTWVVTLASDCYLGIDQEFNIHIEIV